MADEVFIFTRPYTYDNGVVATAVGGTTDPDHPVSDAIDHDIRTYWENDAALPVLKIDLTEAQIVDSLWFNHDNIDTYTLYWSTDDIGYNAVITGTADSGGSSKWLLEFTPRTARYWRLDVTAKVGGGATQVYEIMLMEHRLSLDDDDSFPAMVDVQDSDRSGGGYDLANGAFTTYSGEELFVEIEIVFDKITQVTRDSLYTLFTTPDFRPPITIFPLSAEYPDSIYRVLWEDTTFPLTYDSSLKLIGFSGSFRFIGF